MDVDENAGLFDGYQLKLNSYDLGVDIELADAVQRLRFEHPEVKVVVLKSGKDRVFCAGANIRMLAGSSHTHKVNFCKFTNETRNSMEDASRASGQKYICARARHGGGRRLRAGAGDRPHPARRRRQLDGGAAGAAAAGRAAGHRRPHARHRQAQGAARSGRCLLHRRGGREGRARGQVAAGRPGRAQLQVRAGDQGHSQEARRSNPTGRATPRASPSRRSRARSRTAPSPIPA